MKLNNIEVQYVEVYQGDSVKFFLGNGTTTVLSQESINLKMKEGELVDFVAPGAEEPAEVQPEAAPAEEQPVAEEKPKRKKKSA